MKIAHIVFGMLTGGIETMLINLANCQSIKSQNKVTIYIINKLVNENLIEKLNAAVDVIRINRPVGSINPYYLLKLNWHITLSKYDIIHIHKANILNFILPCFHSKICLTQHENIKAEDITPIKKITKVFSISPSVSNNLKEIGIKSTTILNGINFESFKQKDFQYNIGDMLKCISVGRLEHTIKGQDTLIQAISILKHQGITNVHVDFIGNGSSKDFLKDLVKSLDITDMITFLGEQNQEYIAGHLCDYDLFIQPSLFEGFGLSIVEAMAARLPVMVSEIPGPCDIIQDGKYGFLFPPGDAKKCAMQIDKIIKCGIPPQIPSMAYERALNFDITKTSNEYLSSYVSKTSSHS